MPALPIIIPGTHFPPEDADLLLFVEHMLDMFNATVVAQVAQQAMQKYPQYNPPDNFLRGSMMLTNYFFGCATRRTTRALTKAGNPTYLYRFSYDMHFVEYLLLGDYHSSELPFVFKNEWPPIVHDFDANDRTISDAFTAWWANLAFTGNPNTGPFTPPLNWPVYNEQDDINMQIELPFALNSTLDNEICDFWDQVYEATTNDPAARRDGSTYVPLFLRRKLGMAE